MQMETSRDARVAALGATRQMIADDSFNALVAALVACKAVPRDIMAGALEKLANEMIQKARGEMACDVLVFPTELLEKAKSLGEAAASLRAGGPSLGTVRQ